jgi:hypothetical protein
MKPAPCSAPSAQVLRVTEREGTNDAPCLGVALAMSGAFWLGVSTLLVLVA